MSFCSEKLRASRSAVSTADIANDFTIGIEGEVFSFSHCYNKVTVAEASGLTGETSQIQDFIREYIKPWGQMSIHKLNLPQDSYALVIGLWLWFEFRDPFVYALVLSEIFFGVFRVFKYWVAVFSS